MKILFLMLILLCGCQFGEDSKTIDSLMAEKFGTNKTLRQYLDSNYKGIYEVDKVVNFKKDHRKYSKAVTLVHRKNPREVLTFFLNHSKKWEPGAYAGRLFEEMTGSTFIRSEISMDDYHFDTNVALRKIADRGIKITEKREGEIHAFKWDAAQCDLNMTDKKDVTFRCRNNDLSQANFPGFKLIVSTLCDEIYRACPFELTQRMEEAFAKLSDPASKNVLMDVKVKNQPWIPWKVRVTQETGKPSVMMVYFHKLKPKKSKPPQIKKAP